MPRTHHSTPPHFQVVQRLLEVVRADQQLDLVEEIRDRILDLVEDQNGNHVVQKCLERMQTSKVQFVIDAFRGEVGGH